MKQMARRVQYVIEGLFETRRKKFSDHPMAAWTTTGMTATWKWCLSCDVLDVTHSGRGRVGPG